MTPSYKSESDKLYKAAHDRAEAIQGLYIHLLVFAVINAGIFGINWFTRGDDGGWWFYWALIGWGIGLAIHILVIVAPVFSPEWADRKADRIITDRQS
jgi:hypothetical protein